MEQEQLELIETENKGFPAEFGPGNYFIGDICYALREDIYDKDWGNRHDFKDGNYGIYAVAGTAYGDGCYEGTDGFSYPVDAGNIGVTDMRYSKRTREQLAEMGKVVNVKDKLVFDSDGHGYYTITVDGSQFDINTDYDDEEEESSYDSNDEEDRYLYNPEDEEEI